MLENASNGDSMVLSQGGNKIDGLLEFLLFLKGHLYEVKSKNISEKEKEKIYVSIAGEYSQQILAWTGSISNALEQEGTTEGHALVLVKLIDDICTNFPKAEAHLSNFDNAKKMLINRWAESAAKTSLKSIGVIDGDLEQLSPITRVSMLGALCRNMANSEGIESSKAEVNAVKEWLINRWVESVAKTLPESIGVIDDDLEQLSPITRVSMLGALCENMANSEEIDLNIFSHFLGMLKTAGGDNALQNLESVRLIDHLMKGETDDVVTILQNGDFLSHMKQVIVVVDSLRSSGNEFYTHEVQRNLYKKITETCSEKIKSQAESICKSLEDGEINKSEAWELVKSIDDVYTAFSKAGEPIYYFDYTKQKLLDKWAEFVVNESSDLTGEINGYLSPFLPTTRVSMVQALCKHLNGKVMNGEVEIIPNFTSFLGEIEKFDSVRQDVGSLLDLATIANQIKGEEVNTESLVNRAKILVQKRIAAGGDMLDVSLFLDSRAEKGKIDAPLVSFMEGIQGPNLVIRGPGRVIQGPGLTRITNSLKNLTNLAHKVASRVRFFNKGNFDLARSDGTFDLNSSAKFIRVIFASVYGSDQDSIAYSCASYGFKEAIGEIIEYQNGKVETCKNHSVEPSYLFHDMKVAMRALQGSLIDFCKLPEARKAPIISSLEEHFIELLRESSPGLYKGDLCASEISGFFEVASLILPKLISEKKLYEMQQLIKLIGGLPSISNGSFQSDRYEKVLSITDANISSLAKIDGGKVILKQLFELVNQKCDIVVKNGDTGERTVGNFFAAYGNGTITEIQQTGVVIVDPTCFSGTINEVSLNADIGEMIKDNKIGEATDLITNNVNANLAAEAILTQVFGCTLTEQHVGLVKAVLRSMEPGKSITIEEKRAIWTNTFKAAPREEDVSLMDKILEAIGSRTSMSEEEMRAVLTQFNPVAREHENLVNSMLDHVESLVSRAEEEKLAVLRKLPKEPSEKPHLKEIVSAIYSSMNERSKCVALYHLTMNNSEYVKDIIEGQVKSLSDAKSYCAHIEVIVDVLSSLIRQKENDNNNDQMKTLLGKHFLQLLASLDREDGNALTYLSSDKVSQLYKVMQHALTCGDFKEEEKSKKMEILTDKLVRYSGYDVLNRLREEMQGDACILSFVAEPSRRNYNSTNRCDWRDDENLKEDFDSYVSRLTKGNVPNEDEQSAQILGDMLMAFWGISIQTFETLMCRLGILSGRKGPSSLNALHGQIPQATSMTRDGQPTPDAVLEANIGEAAAAHIDATQSRVESGQARGGIRV
jgi:hypothetical protein